MEIIRDDQKKLIQVWFNNREKQDAALQSRLKSAYAKWSQERYLVAVYQSGSRDLYQSTLDLLSHNKKRCAELAVRQEKKTAVTEG